MGFAASCPASLKALWLCSTEDEELRNHLRQPAGHRAALPGKISIVCLKRLSHYLQCTRSCLDSLGSRWTGKDLTVGQSCSLCQPPPWL